MLAWAAVRSPSLWTESPSGAAPNMYGAGGLGAAASFKGLLSWVPWLLPMVLAISAVLVSPVFPQVFPDKFYSSVRPTAYLQGHTPSPTLVKQRTREFILATVTPSCLTLT